MLSAICLEVGCAHVTGIDTNVTMCDMAERHLKPLGRPLPGSGSKAPRFRILHSDKGKLPEELKGQKFDMMVRRSGPGREQPNLSPPFSLSPSYPSSPPRWCPVLI
jgi:hypothetical protein